jgi:hypothetical protein
MQRNAAGGLGGVPLFSFFFPHDWGTKGVEELIADSLPFIM